jgi:nucleotide-binding universal stress UspA family protein
MIEGRARAPAPQEEDAMYKRVLIPLDGSEVAEAILPFIFDIAGPLDLEIVLLRVNRPIPPTVVDGTRVIEVEDMAGRRREAQVYLDGIARELVEKGLRVETRVRRGEPVAEILAGARAEGADLIAMTTHGRTGPARLLFGSVAEGVLRHSGIPVFLMRHTEREIARRRRREEVVSS